MQFSVYQHSHIGGRKVNQDRMGYCFTRDALLLVLADGMGGHQHGEIAATIAMQTLSMMFQMQARPYIKKPERFLEEALQQAHRDILAYTVRHKLPESPRTTVVACLVQHNCAVWAHCGDSRLYLVRGGRMLMRTRDHSYAEYPEVASASRPPRNRNVLFTCLGSPSRPLPQSTTGSPARSSGPTSATTWSMQTRPRTGRRVPPTQTSARFPAWRGTPSP